MVKNSIFYPVFCPACSAAARSKKIAALLALILLPLFSAGAQKSPPSGAPYQIPQTLYVGDSGKLVYPLNALLAIPEDAKISAMPEIADDLEDIENLENRNASADIIIHKIELDKDKKNLIIDFQIFRTGIIEIPPVMIGGEMISGLKVTVSSLLDSGNNSMTLSPPAPPLSAPGTFWLFTSIVLGAIVVLLIIYFLWKRGRDFLYSFNTDIKSIFLIFSMQRVIKRLHKNLAKEKITNADAVSVLANESRIFLSRFLNIPCISMVPEEFLEIQFNGIEDVNADFRRTLFDFFKNSDSLRFSGDSIAEASVNELIARAKEIIKQLQLNGRK